MQVGSSVVINNKKYVPTEVKNIHNPESKYLYHLKGTVSRDGRGYKSGINRKVSLNPIASEAKQDILLKGLFTIYI